MRVDPVMATAGASSAPKFSLKLSEATEAGDKFVKLFYETFDKRRQLIKGLYSETSFLVWNGHTKSGADDINSFYQMLPNSSHSIQSFDCQPVSDAQDHTTVLVCCEGIVGYDEHSNEQSFTQNFLLIKQSDVWKIEYFLYIIILLVVVLCKIFVTLPKTICFNHEKL